MRFSRFPRSFQRPITARRLAAARKAIQRERDKAGLFAFELPKVTPEERCKAWDKGADEWWTHLRDFNAKQWREGRRILFAMPAERRRTIVERWNAAPYPGSSEYFLEFMNGRCAETRTLHDPQDADGYELAWAGDQL
ncbi:MAG: hypothetical protein ACE147_00810 [Candidatus Methylomirabilales bacterium]